MLLGGIAVWLTTLSDGVFRVLRWNCSALRKYRVQPYNTDNPEVPVLLGGILQITT